MVGYLSTAVNQFFEEERTEVSLSRKPCISRATFEHFLIPKREKKKDFLNFCLCVLCVCVRACGCVKCTCVHSACDLKIQAPTGLRRVLLTIELRAKLLLESMWVHFQVLTLVNVPYLQVAFVSSLPLCSSHNGPVFFSKGDMNEQVYMLNASP